jgi:hypothetical protein
MKRTMRLLPVAFAIVFGVQTDAHHSQAAVYKGGEKVVIEGELVQVLIRSPHSFVHVMAKDENGDTHRYAIEWGGAAQLARNGVDGKTLRIGDHVVIEGNPGRNPVDRRLLMVTLTRPSDGFSWGRREGEVVD